MLGLFWNQVLGTTTPDRPQGQVRGRKEPDTLLALEAWELGAIYSPLYNWLSAQIASDLSSLETSGRAEQEILCLLRRQDPLVSKKSKDLAQDIQPMTDPEQEQRVRAAKQKINGFLGCPFPTAFPEPRVCWAKE